jgi:hypothetical protein
MIRTNKVSPWTEVLNLTDKEFVEKIGSSIEVKTRIVYKNVRNLKR